MLEAFAPTARVERRLRQQNAELLEGETVSVQIRRGDYVGQGMLRRYDLELDWYREALDRVGDVDRIVVLHKGCICEEGTHAELLAHGGMYAKLYELQFKEQEKNAFDDRAA